MCWHCNCTSWIMTATVFGSSTVMSTWPQVCCTYIHTILYISSSMHIFYSKSPWCSTPRQGLSQCDYWLSLRVCWYYNSSVHAVFYAYVHTRCRLWTHCVRCVAGFTCHGWKWVVNATVEAASWCMSVCSSSALLSITVQVHASGLISG